MEYVNGGIAGAFATIATNSIDVVKIRMQLQGEMRARNEHKALYRNIAHAHYVIARTDGILALQKGLVPAMLVGFSLNAVRLGMYQVAEVQGWTRDKQGGLSVPKAIFWSCVSGALSGVVTNPITLIKTRIQAESHPSIAVGKQHRYNGMWDGCINIYRKEGMRGFLAGWDASCARIGIGSAAQLTSYSGAKEVLKNHGLFESSPLGLAFTASAISGVVVVLIGCPLDVVNIRLFNQGKDRLYNGVLDCFAKVYKTEGIHGLYKGVGPLYLRLAPHTTLSLVMWDVLNNLLQKQRNKNT